MASAIGRTADGLVDALPDEQRRLVRGVLVRMTELGEGSEDSRRRVAVGELVPEGAAAGSVEALLQRLAEERLVTLDDGSAEVAHEALIREWPQLRRWLDEDRAGIRAHQQLGDAARLWDAGGREPSDLYRGARLAAALELVESRRAQLNATERAFLDAAAEEADRERRAERRTNRRLRGLLAGAAVLLVVALLGGVLAILSRNTAQDAERAAEAQALTADAQRIGALSRAAPTLAQSMLYARRGGRGGGHRRDPRRPARRAAAQLGGGPQPAVVVGQPHGRRRQPTGCWPARTPPGSCASSTSAPGRRAVRRWSWDVPSTGGPSPSRPTGGRSPWRRGRTAGRRCT